MVITDAPTRLKDSQDEISKKYANVTFSFISVSIFFPLIDFPIFLQE